MSHRREKVRQAVDPDRLRNLFLDLLAIYSPSGKEEDVQLYLEELLAQRGFAVERQEVDEERYNLHLTMGATEPQLYLVGHVDTVTAWDLDEFGPQQDGGIVRGLGSADARRWSKPGWHCPTLCLLRNDRRRGCCSSSARKRTVTAARLS